MMRKLHTFVLPLLKDKNGANAVEYALIMALGGIFMITGLILMSTEMGSLFSSMGACLGDVANCGLETFSSPAPPPPPTCCD